MKRLSRFFEFPPSLPVIKFLSIITLVVIFSCLSPLPLASPGAVKVQAKAGSAYDLIAAVNQLREANGLPAYQVNASLMASAQGHSDYQASIGMITHTGAGGSNAKSRAIAAGYGGGATVYVSENIAGGTSMTYQTAVQMWQGDNLHLNTMLGGSYTDVGAGVASDGTSVYFTLDVGYIAGSPGSGASVVPNATPLPGGSSSPVTQPIVTATPAPDGSITHTVGSGQTLWAISAVYKVALQELLDLNGFTNSTLIFPGNTILIKPASITATPEVTMTAPLPTNTPARRPTRTTTTTAEPSETDQVIQSSPLNEPKNPVEGSGTLKFDPVLIVIGALVIGGAALMILGNYLKQRPSNE